MEITITINSSNKDDRTKILKDVIKLMRKLHGVKVLRDELFKVLPEQYKKTEFLYKHLYSELEQDTVLLMKDTAPENTFSAKPEPVPTKVNEMYVKLYGYVNKETFDDCSGNELFTVKDLKQLKSFLEKTEKDFDLEKNERKRNFVMAVFGLIFSSIAVVLATLTFVFGGNGILN